MMARAVLLTVVALLSIAGEPRQNAWARPERWA
jgi:hypothetical protein